ncbi:MAG: hypothetical protein HY077_16395 [Elusimicrobia bacterium]|nr:hypothetical protein [Elusimicrobiota bacterium]
MAELNVSVEVSVSPAVFRAALAAALLSVMAGELASESVSLTTYYPAPSGVYTQMITTSDTYLARDGGKVGVGTGTTTAPTATLTVGTPPTGTAPSTFFATNAGALGGVAGNETSIASFGFTSANSSMLGVRAYRNSAGADWTTTSIGLGMDVDNTVRAGASLWLNNNGSVGVGYQNAASGAAASSRWVGLADLNDGRNTADGFTWYNPAPTAYGIYRTANTYPGCGAGAWCAGTAAPSGAYQQLQTSWVTGLILDGGTDYAFSGTYLQPNAGAESNVAIGRDPTVGQQAQARLDVNGIMLSRDAPPLTLVAFTSGVNTCANGMFATTVSGFFAKYIIIIHGQNPLGEMLCESCPSNGCPSL